MAAVIHKPRNGCALHGAVATVEEINGAVPIVHSNAGCGIQNYLANKVNGLGNTKTSGFSAPGTAVQERHIIFGGASRLREQIKNTIKVFQGDLYVVLNSCESAMVGDDIDAMTKEAFEQGEPVIDSILAGFHGDRHLGYSQVVTDIFQKLPQIYSKNQEKDKKLVNILGILPQQDLFFKGELEELERILEGIGLKVNTFFGSGNGVEEFASAPSAALTLVFSQWGIAPAKKLQELYEIPYLQFRGVPTGIEEVSAFVEAIAEALSIEKESYQNFLQKEEKKFSYYLSRVEEEFYSEGVIRDVALIGDERTVTQTAGFLKKYLDAQIKLVVITDYFPSEDNPETEKRQELQKIAENVYLTSDAKEIERIIFSSDIEIVLGSSLEEKAANQKGAVHLAISYPVYRRTIINKSYAGIQGALSLTEDYITKVKEYNHRKEEQLSLH